MYGYIKKIIWFIVLGVGLLGIAASVGGYKPENVTEDIAKAGSSDMFISSLDGIDFTEYGDAKRVLSYYSVVYGLNVDQLNATIECESGFRHDKLFGDHGKAYGIAQFHEPTFNQFCDGDYKNMEDQLHCFAKMVKDKLQSHWTCAKF